jgi:DNA-binding SARP family transcriptional activator/tetratricopeptide (TPR) repeat protein
MGTKLEIRLLGDLAVLRDGRALELPASKKTRALLGYLVATGKPQLRERLCEILWDGPDDPRGALRWALTKIRPLLDEGKTARLVADRERVAFEAHGARVDLLILQSELAGGVAAASVATLRAAAERFRGEFLEGLDLPACYHFHEWCVGEREAMRTLRLSVLAALVEKLRDDPEEALRFARARLAIDPLAEVAHVAVMQLLRTLGRTREAREQYEGCRRMLESEFGARPSAEIERIRMSLGPPRAAPPAAPAPRPPPRTVVELPPMVGRGRERDTVKSLVEQAQVGKLSDVLLVLGDPGIGKTRLLADLASSVRRVGGLVLGGRAFEAEMVRPYGAWIDALRSVPLGDVPTALRADLALLLPELGDESTAAVGDRSRLFDAVAQLLGGLAKSAPVAVVLDDVQWLDEASAALLCSISRATRGGRILLACGGRSGELFDNPAALRLVRTLEREKRLVELLLAPLEPGDIAALLASVDPALDAGRVFRESEGNPFFALEIAQALRCGDEEVSHTVQGLIAERLERLEGRARDLVPWAATLGRTFSAEVLGRVTSVPPAELLSGIEELERRGVIRAASGGRADYDFTHDLVRQTAYRRQSEPRRKLLHLQIARALAAAPDIEGALAGDIAHHAALGADAELSVRFCLAAGNRCRRLFAHAEAAELGERGLAQLASLPRETRVRLQIGLLELFVWPGMDRARVSPLITELSRAVLEAQAMGLRAEVASGFFALSILHYDSGDFADAHRETVHVTDAVRAGVDPATTLKMISHSGRCLVQLERELPRAHGLLLEAQAIAARAGQEVVHVPWGLGMLHLHRGEYELAVPLLEHGLVLARRDEDHWAECDCLSWLVRVGIEQGRPREALDRCRELLPIAAKMGDGSEAPLAVALEALARRALAEPGADEALETALKTLRAIDSKRLISYALLIAAEQDLAAGRVEMAGARAEEALTAAETVNRRTEIAHAHAILATVALMRGQKAEAVRHIQATLAGVAEPYGVSARARAAVASAAEAAGVPMPPAPELPLELVFNDHSNGHSHGGRAL